MEITNQTISNTSDNFIWLFNGCSSKGISGFPSGIFNTIEHAEYVIKNNRLSGTLTKYPIDTFVYDYAISNGWFTPKKDYQKEPSFIQRFSSAYLEHYRYEEGNEIW